MDKPVYLRLGSFGFNATPVRLWTDGAFRTYTNFDFMIFGLTYGVIACMILYNLFICISLRNGTYLAYVMNMLSVLACLLILNGHVSSLVNLDGYTIQTMEFAFLGLFIFFSVSFCKRFYDTRANLPRLHWVAVFFQWVGLVIILLGMLRMYMPASIVASAAGVAGTDQPYPDRSGSFTAGVRPGQILHCGQHFPCRRDHDLCSVDCWPVLPGY